MLEMAESGIPLQEIADEMNKTKEAIKMRLKRIRKARREALK
jgi:DNA-directed RNA polymerase specialized sigma24 family protein|tara:strand:- start:786 stop:911 length:126 start_codon:yes stop_codon:yes gene_type:complete